MNNQYMSLHSENLPHIKPSETENKNIGIMIVMRI